MSYVDDLVHGTKLANESQRASGEIINIGNDQELSILDIAILIHKLANTGNELKLEFKLTPEIFRDYKEIARWKTRKNTQKAMLSNQEFFHSKKQSFRLPNSTSIPVEQFA
jgi:nucleoside-diphosphate-sugar epimerase